MILYRDILANALRLSWRAKFLWVLAFFVALGGLGGEYEFFFRGTSFVTNQSSTLDILRADYIDGSLMLALHNLPSHLTQLNASVYIIVAVVLLALFFLILWVILTAQGGLIWAIDQVQSQGKEKTELGKAFGVGHKKFGSLFVVNMVMKVALYVLLALITVPLGVAFIRSGIPAYLLWYAIGSFVILVPVSIIISFLLKYAAIAIVLRGENWKQGLSTSWNVFRRNWLVSLEIALVLYAINLVTTLVLIYAMDIMGFPSNPAGAILFATVLTLWGTFIAAFQYTTWVLLYEHLEAGTAQSKISRVMTTWNIPLPGGTPSSPTKPAAAKTK